MALVNLVNLVAIALLSGIAFRLLQDDTRQRRAGDDPVFTRDLMPDLDGVRCGRGGAHGRPDGRFEPRWT